MSGEDGAFGCGQGGEVAFARFDEADGVADGEAGGVHDLFAETIGEVGDEGDCGVSADHPVVECAAGEVLSEECVAGALRDDFVEEDFVGGAVVGFQALGAVPDNGAGEAGAGEGVEEGADGGIDFAFDGGMVVFEEAAGFAEVEERLHAEAVVVVLDEGGGEDELGLDAGERVDGERGGGAFPGFVALEIDDGLPAAS